MNKHFLGKKIISFVAQLRAETHDNMGSIQHRDLSGGKSSISLIKVQVKGRNQNGGNLDVWTRVIGDANIAWVRVSLSEVGNTNEYA